MGETDDGQSRKDEEFLEYRGKVHGKKSDNEHKRESRGSVERGLGGENGGRKKNMNLRSLTDNHFWFVSPNVDRHQLSYDKLFSFDILNCLRL